MTASVVRLSERIRSLTPDRQIAAIASDVDGLGVLARTTAEAQRATGEAMGVLADATARIAEVQQEHGERLERIEAGVLEAIEIGRSAERGVRAAQESDVDLAATVERERAARAARDEEVRTMLAPIVADASRRAGNSASAKTAGALSVAALVAGLAAQPVETIKLLREIGPVGAAVAVVVLLAALVWSRRGRS